MEKINVCFSVDDKYVEHCAVTMASILDNSDSHFHFYILSSGISLEKKKTLENVKKIRDFNLTLIDINQKDFKDCFIPPNSHFGIANYFRLKIPSLLSDLNKVIYLDSDIVVVKDLKGMWDTPFDDHYIIACRSMVSRRNCLRLGLPEDAPYINSGVIFFNLEKMRSDEIEKRFFDCIKNDPQIMQNVDQDAINIVLLQMEKGIKQIKQNWNTEVRTDIPFESEYEKIVNDPYLIHFITGDKPWNKDSKQLYKEKYWHYRKKLFNKNIIYLTLYNFFKKNK